MDQEKQGWTRIGLLGGLEVTHDEGRVSFATKSAALLFAFLVLHEGKRVSRERLADMFWPEMDGRRSKRNLSTTIWRVNTALDGVPTLDLRSDREFITLNCAESQVDIRDFLRACNAWKTAKGEVQLDLLRQIEVLYAGDFLDGFADAWCDEERRVLRGYYCEALHALAKALQERREHVEALARFLRLLQVDPYDEIAHRGVMLSHYFSRNRTAALEHYAKMKRLLASELAVIPSTETSELYEHIRAQAKWVAGYSSVGAQPTEPSLQNFPDLPLLGREEELLDIVTGIEQAERGKGGATVVVGGLGIGKTRLIQSCIAEAGLRNVEILQGRCPHLDSTPPYQVLIQAIWPRVSTGLHAANPWSSVLKALVDSLSLGPLVGSKAKVHFPAADRVILDECILSTLSDPTYHQPILLVLEDLHRVDEATEHFLVTLLGRLGSMRVHVLVTLREDENRGPQVLSALLANGARVTALGPLTPGEVSQLVASALGISSVPDDLVDFIWDRSAGVPLFAVELLKFVISEHCVQRDAAGRLFLDMEKLRARSEDLPVGLQEVIRRRVARFGDREKSVIFSAAVLGMESTFGQIERLMGTPEDEFIEAVERLVGARLLHETDEGLGFPHEAVRQSVLGLIPKHRLRRMHLKAAALLEETAPGGSSDLAWHYLGAGLYGQASAHFETAADSARIVHANEDALSWYTRAIDAIENLDDSSRDTLKSRASLLLKRQEVLDLLGRRERQAEDIDSLLAVAANLGDQTLQGRAALLRSAVLSRLNRNREALEAAREAEFLFSQVDDKLGQAKALEAAGVVFHFNLRNERQAGHTFRRALALYRRLRDRAGEARALVNLGIVIASNGQNTEALSTLDQAEDILRDLPSRRDLAVVLLQKGILYRFVGQNSKSEDLLQNGISMLRQIGDRIGEARGLSQLAATHVAMGRLRDALHESIKAIRLAREAHDIRAHIVFLNNVAHTVLRCLGYFERAQRSVTRALKMIAQSGQAENVTIYYDTIGSIMLEKGDLTSALRWLGLAREAFRAWEGRYAFVEAEIDYRLGLVWMSLGRPKEAYRLLDKASRRWVDRSDLLLQAHAMAALGRLELASGNREAALGKVREVERLLRRVDGVEQIQKVYWNQYLVYRGLRADAAARKALKKAFMAVSDQAELLKGPMRRRFLEAVPANREILQEAQRVGVYGPAIHLGEGRPPAQAISQLATERRLPISERRKLLVELASRAGLRQKDVASVLRVSVRTVRSDLTALRSEGLLAGPMMRRQPDAPQDVVS